MMDFNYYQTQMILYDLRIFIEKGGDLSDDTSKAFVPEINTVWMIVHVKLKLYEL